MGGGHGDTEQCSKHLRALRFSSIILASQALESRSFRNLESKTDTLVYIRQPGKRKEAGYPISTSMTIYYLDFTILTMYHIVFAFSSKPFDLFKHRTPITSR
jgi:hypothetical protein